MRNSVILLLALALVGALAQSGSASVIVEEGDTFSVQYNNIWNFNGGPFKATVNSDEVYWTFCCQMNTTIGEGIDYSVLSVQEKTEAQPHYYLTAYGAWLYAEFTERLDNLVSTSGNDIDSYADISLAHLQSAFDGGVWWDDNAGLKAIQNAIWTSLVDELDTNGVGDDSLISVSGNVQYVYDVTNGNSALSQLHMTYSDFRADSTWNEDGTGGVDLTYLGDVHVANIVDKCNGDKQDQLCYTVPSEFPGQVPEPTTLVVWSLLGGLGLAGSRIRRKKK